MTAAGLSGYPVVQRLRQPRRQVAVLRAENYDVDLVDILLRAIREFPHVVERAKGGRVFLKPNLVEYNAARPINTDPRVVVAAAEAFWKLGAREILVGDGPGHRRDTHLLVHQSGLAEQLRLVGVPFVDLNVDATKEVRLPWQRTSLGSLHLPRSVVEADLLVSMPKMKTHHWAGTTLSMKNLFGCVPGSMYGFPKNVLHWAGISQSIVDLWSTLRPGFNIVDGIVGMDGDGPIMGAPVKAGILVVGDHSPAVDAVTTHLMGLREDRIHYLHQVGGPEATVSLRRIEHIGDVVQPLRFEVLDHFAHLRI